MLLTVANYRNIFLPNIGAGYVYLVLRLLVHHFEYSDKNRKRNPSCLFFRVFRVSSQQDKWLTNKRKRRYHWLNLLYHNHARSNAELALLKMEITWTVLHTVTHENQLYLWNWVLTFHKYFSFLRSFSFIYVLYHINRYKTIFNT